MRGPMIAAHAVRTVIAVCPQRIINVETQQPGETKVPPRASPRRVGVWVCLAHARTALRGTAPTCGTWRVDKTQQRGDGESAQAQRVFYILRRRIAAPARQLQLCVSLRSWRPTVSGTMRAPHSPTRSHSPAPRPCARAASSCATPTDTSPHPPASEIAAPHLKVAAAAPPACPHGVTRPRADHLYLSLVPLAQLRGWARVRRRARERRAGTCIDRAGSVPPGRGGDRRTRGNARRRPRKGGCE